MLERSWLFTRLVQASDPSTYQGLTEILAEVVPGLVACLQQGDPASDWHFNRADEGPQQPAVVLGFHATPEVLAEVTQRLHSLPPTISAVFTEAGDAPADDTRHGPLARAASDLALALFRCDEWFPETELPLTVLHLQQLTRLLPEADRLGFLSHFWQEQVRHLTQAQRRDIAVQADSQREKILLAAAELQQVPAFAAIWESYLKQVRAFSSAPRDTPPLGYLLFRHAQLTHQRLGIPPSVDSLGAMALRLSLVGPPAHPVRQTVRTRHRVHTSAMFRTTPAASTTASIRQIDVALDDRSYPIRIGSGVRHELPQFIAAIGARRVVVVSARPPDWTPNPGVPHRVVPARDGEHDKTLATVEELCRAFADFGLTRGDAVVSCGGGTTTDVVGLAAGLYHRGIPVLHVPTSLLAQVDASVGGKTAVNLPQGKNLVGMYWQPRAVLCDTDYLSTLPKRELLNGYGEIARCHFIGAGDLRGLPLTEQIAASVALKASVVAADERDAGLRHILNYGHTLGHALERVTNFRLRHGEAVGIGTVFAGRLAGLLDRIDEARVVEHEEVVASYGLATTLPPDLDHSSLIAVMRLDKKARSGLSFVLDGPNGAELVEDIPESVVIEALGSMGVGDPTG